MYSAPPSPPRPPPLTSSLSWSHVGGAACKSCLRFPSRTKGRKITKKRIPQGYSGGSSQHVLDTYTPCPQHVQTTHSPRGASPETTIVLEAGSVSEGRPHPVPSTLHVPLFVPCKSDPGTSSPWCKVSLPWLGGKLQPSMDFSGEASNVSGRGAVFLRRKR